MWGKILFDTFSYPPNGSSNSCVRYFSIGKGNNENITHNLFLYTPPPPI